MDHPFSGQQPNSRVTFTFIALNCNDASSAGHEVGKIREKKSPAHIVRVSQTHSQPCREGCAGCQGAPQGGRQDPVCPCGTRGSQPRRSHAAEAAGISSSRGGAEQMS